MGYRKHLKVIKRSAYEKHLSEYVDNEDMMFCEGICKINTEIDVDFPIDNLDDVGLRYDDEYPPKVLSKKDIRGLLLFYQKKQSEYSKKRMELYKNIDVNDESSIDKLVSSEFTTFLHNSSISSYFDKRIETKGFLGDSDFFLLQYFYLLMIYQSYFEEEYVFIITHG